MSAAAVPPPAGDTDTLREALGYVLADNDAGTWLADDVCERLADALLPVVQDYARRVAADELRAAADAIDDDARVEEARRLRQAQRAVGEARSVVLERADALEADR